MRPILSALIPVAIVLASVLGSAGCDQGLPDADFDLKPFIETAKKAGCADEANRLFLIDGEMVFWDRRGACADARFSFTLFGRTPDEVLCQSYDSFAGPMTSCPEAFADLFETIITHLDAEDLGLGADHTVEPIPF
ncbi:hypothetical protein [Rhodocaloribacter sp.]